MEFLHSGLFYFMDSGGSCTDAGDAVCAVSRGHIGESGFIHGKWLGKLSIGAVALWLPGVLEAL